MSMIICNECGKEISDKAQSCPNCGNPINIVPIQPQSQKPIKKPESTLGNVAIILSLLGCLAPLGFILAIIDLCINDKTKKHQTSVGALIICSLWLILSFSLGNRIDDNDETKSTKVNQTIEETTEDDTIDFEYEDIYVKFLESKVENGKLYVYFEMKNGSDENYAFDYTFTTTAFQNGVELETDYIYNCDEEENGSKEIQPGTTIKVAEVFELSDNISTVTLEVAPLIDFSNTKLLTFNIEL